MLTRLLYPEIFGLMSLLHSILYVLALLSDVGLSGAVMTSRREDRDFLTRSGLSTPHAASRFGWWRCSSPGPCSAPERTEAALAVAAGATVSIWQGIASSPWVLRRRMQVAPIIKLEVLANAACVATMVTLAWLGFGITSTLAGNVRAKAPCRPWAATLPIELGRPRLMVDATAKLEITNFGRWIFFSSCLTAVINKETSSCWDGCSEPLNSASIKPYWRWPTCPNSWWAAWSRACCCPRWRG